MYKSLIAASLSILLCGTALADDYNTQNREVGWFFNEAKKAPDHKVVIKKVVYAQTKPMQKPHKINCQDKNQWVAACGFINPSTQQGTLNQKYNFEQHEMTQLMRQASMSANDAKKVYQFQKFNWWAVNQAMNMSYTWNYNVAQHPDVDPNVKNPSSAFALLMVSKINDTAEKQFYHMLSKSAYLVYFTRSDCEYCHVEAPLVRSFAQETGLKIVNASLDSDHIKQFKYFMTAPKTLMPARILQVGTVPTLFLYLKPNKTGAVHSSQFIRVATGVVTKDIIKQRIIDFVRAYRHAIVEGVVDGHKKYAPNFKVDGMNKLATDNSYLNPDYKKWVVNKSLQGEK